MIIESQQELDSVKALLPLATEDTVKICIYSSLAQALVQSDLLLSKLYTDSALSLINSSESKIGVGFLEQFKALNYNTLSNINYQQGNFNAAIQYCLKNIKIFEKHKDLRNVSRLNSSIGVILKSIGNSKDALNYIRKSVAIDERSYYSGEKSELVLSDLSGSYINMSATFLELEMNDSSIYYAYKSLGLLDTTKKSEDLGLVYTNIGAAYAGLENYPIAISFTEKALINYLAAGLPEKTSIAYSNLSELNLLTKNYTKALYYSDLSEKISKENLLGDNLLHTYDVKAKIYSELKDSKNEILFLKKSASLKDSLLELNHTREMEELKTQYETEKKEIEIVKLSADNKIQELRLNRFVIIIISIIVVLLLLIGLAFFLIKNIRERKKAYIKLQEKNIEIQKQGEQLSEQAKLIAKYQSQMNPHFVFNALNSIQGTVLNDEKDKTIDRLQLLSQLMRQTLNNSENDHITLEEELNYLKTYVAFEQQKFNNSLKFEIEHPEDHSDILIPPMMIQPFIENAIKHAGLQNLKDAYILLKITAENELLKILIKDNGEGFDAKDGSVLKNSHAIKIIQSRLQLLFITEKESNNIHFKMRSKPELQRGTEIEFYLPLNYKY